MAEQRAQARSAVFPGLSPAPVLTLCVRDTSPWGKAIFWSVITKVGHDTQDKEFRFSSKYQKLRGIHDVKQVSITHVSRIFKADDLPAEY